MKINEKGKIMWQMRHRMIGTELGNRGKKI